MIIKTALPIDLIPSTLRDIAEWAGDVKGAEFAVGFSAGLASLSAVAGKNINVVRTCGLTGLQVFEACVSKTGSGKGAVVPVTQPLRDISDELKRKFKEEEKGFILQEKYILSLLIAKDGESPRKEIKLPVGKNGFPTVMAASVKRNYDYAEGQRSGGGDAWARCRMDEVMRNAGAMVGIVTQNATQEALQKFLYDNNGQGTIFSTDAKKVLLNIHNSKRESGGSSFIMQSYCGEPIEELRMGRDGNDIARPWLTCHLCIVPEIYDTWSETIAGEGFLGRIMVFRPITEIIGDSEKIAAGKTEIPEAVMKKWAELLQEIYNNRATIGDINIAGSPAETILIDWQNEVNHKRRHYDGVAANDELASRWYENTLKLAGLLHLAEHGKAAGHNLMAPKTAEAAIKIARWLIACAAITEDENLEKAKSDLEKKAISAFARKAKGRDSITLKELAHGIRGDKNKATYAAHLMEKSGAFNIQHYTNGNGKPSILIRRACKLTAMAA